METGAITGYIDVAQLVLYAFWIFFAGLIIYLRKEDKREGYPMESDRTERSGGRVISVGYPSLPEPKSFLLHDGSMAYAPREENDARVLKAEPADRFPGAPFKPVGDPMQAEVGPGSYALRADVPDQLHNGEPKIVPMRVAPDFAIEPRDPDPRGMPVIGADRAVAGTISDVWVDRMENMIRYLEVKLDDDTVLLPMNFARIQAGRRSAPGSVTVNALLASQFRGVPRLQNPEQVTFLEEDKVMAYYGAGTLYATPERAEPLL